MEIKYVWCVKTHIVNNCETITDEVRLFNSLENAARFFGEVVDGERRLATENEWVIEYDDNYNFNAYEEGYYVQNHSYISLFEIPIE